MDLLLIDGRHLLWRAVSSYNLSVQRGPVRFYTGGMYGWLRIALSSWQQLGGDSKVVVAWESPTGPTARRAIFQDYKQKPKTMDLGKPDNTRQTVYDQERELRKILQSLGIRQAHAKSWEADDVVATLATKAARIGTEVGILSGDRDLLQLVEKNVSLIRPIKRDFKVETPATVHEEFGVTPEQILDIKALAGDSGDNVPGVPGIGMKTASKLVQEHGSWQEVITWAETNPVKLKWHGSLLEHISTVRQAAALVRLNCDASLTWTVAKQDRKLAFTQMASFKFNSLLSDQKLNELLAMG